MLAQFVDGGLYGGWIYYDLLLSVDLLHAIQIPAQSIAVPDTVSVGDSAELAAGIQR